MRSEPRRPGYARKLANLTPAFEILNKKTTVLALFWSAVVLLLLGLTISNVSLAGGGYRQALLVGFILAVLADILLAVVFVKGSVKWRIGASVAALPSLYVFFDFLTRGR